MKLRVFLACLVSRVLRFGLRLLGHGGTAFPGKAALRICPGLMRELSRGVETVLVTGTNGKTTTCGMLRHMLDKTGTPYFSNRSGANLTSGITAELIENADLFGKPRKKLAVIECDEGNFPAVAGAMQPRAVVVTNLFRDQLDRYGEVTHTRNYIAEGIKKAAGAVLCLNADCSLTASLGWDVPNTVLYYGLNSIVGQSVPNVSDAPNCLRCGTRYAYRRHTYAHLGDWYCPNCGAHRPDPGFAVESIRPSQGGSFVTMTTPEGEVSFRLALPAIYNASNAAAALTAAHAMGWDEKACRDSLADFGAVFGRMEQLTIGETPVRIVLVKNPAGCDRALEFLAGYGEDVLPIFCLNDNTADGTDVSWVWDADYESLFAARQYKTIGVYGTRAQDMRIRLKYAGADDAAITVYDTVDALAEAVKNSSVPVVVLPNYTSMLTVRDKLSSLAGGGRFWE